MTGLERNLKYWFSYVGKSIGQIYLMIVGIVAVMSFLDGSDFLMTFSKNLVMYLVMASAMSIMVFGFSNITIIFPTTVSFSSKRSTSLIGMTVAQHVMCILSFAVAFVFGLYIEPNFRPMAGPAIPVVLGGICFLFFIGNIMAVLSDRFGRTLGMVLYMLFVFALVFVIVFGYNYLAGGKGEALVQALFTNLGAASVIICALGVLLDVIGVWILAAGIKNKDLKF